MDNREFKRTKVTCEKKSKIKFKSHQNPYSRNCNKSVARFWYHFFGFVRIKLKKKKYAYRNEQVTRFVGGGGHATDVYQWSKVRQGNNFRGKRHIRNTFRVFGLYRGNDREFMQNPLRHEFSARFFFLRFAKFFPVHREVKRDSFNFFLPSESQTKIVSGPGGLVMVGMG